MVLEKTIAREKFRRLRSEHSADEKRLADQALQKRLFHFLNELRPKSVLAYEPFKTEAHPFTKSMIEDFAVPNVEGEVFHAVKLGARVDPKALDMVLVPGVAFDRHGNRLGFGKGYYDRFLKTTQAKRVGIAYSFQVSSEELASEPWDEPVDWIITDCYVLHVERKDQGKWKS